MNLLANFPEARAKGGGVIIFFEDKIVFGNTERITAPWLAAKYSAERAVASMNAGEKKLFACNCSIRLRGYGDRLISDFADCADSERMTNAGVTLPLIGTETSAPTGTDCEVK